MNLCVCPEAGITFTAHIVRFHPPFCCDPYCCNPPWQLKAVRGWFSVYRSQNVCQTFLTLHHSLGELHQPHSIFRLWENPMTHAPLMTSPSVNLTAPLGFPESKNRMWLMQFSQGVVQCQKRLADVLGPINREPSSHSLQLPGWITAVWITAKWRMESHYVCCECDTSFRAHTEIHGQETG